MGSSTREPWEHEATRSTIPITRRNVLTLAALGAAAGVAEPARAALPQGQITYAVHISLAPTWLDPAETSGIITPFMLLYALHDAMAKGMPGQLQAPCLAEIRGRRRRTVSPMTLRCGGACNSITAHRSQRRT